MRISENNGMKIKSEVGSHYDRINDSFMKEVLQRNEEELGQGESQFHHAYQYYDEEDKDQGGDNESDSDEEEEESEEVGGHDVMRLPLKRFLNAGKSKLIEEQVKDCDAEFMSPSMRDMCEMSTDEYQSQEMCQIKELSINHPIHVSIKQRNTSGSFKIKPIELVLKSRKLGSILEASISREEKLDEEDQCFLLQQESCEIDGGAGDEHSDTLPHIQSEEVLMRVFSRL